MMHVFEFSKSQMRTLTLLGLVVLAAGNYGLVRDYRMLPENRPHGWQSQAMDEYRPQLELDVNFSPADSLELIPGIGPVLAGRIDAYRRSKNGLITVDSLINVSGIGPVTLDKIRKYFKVDKR